MLLKTKDSCGKHRAEAGMSMKIKEIRVKSGNVTENEGVSSFFDVMSAQPPAFPPRG
jgi:hypothetical protein